MTGSIFQWIYCLDISILVFIIIAVTLVFTWGFRRYEKQQWCRPAIGLLLAVCTAAIFAVTLLIRSSSPEQFEPSLLPFASYRYVLEGDSVERLRSNFMNVVLFYPAGLFAAVLLPQRWNPVLRILLVSLVFAFISAGIEYAQYAFVLGQLETDDVIHNTLGACIGSLCGSFIILREET